MICGTYCYDLALKRRTFMAAWRTGLVSWPMRLILFGVLPLGFAYGFWQSWHRHQHDLVIFLTLFVVLFMLMPLFYVVVVLPRRFRAEPYADTDITICFSDDGMVQKGVAGESRITWTGIHKAREMQKHFLLIFHNRLVMLVPKEAFANEADLRAIRRLFAAHAKE